MLDNNHLKDLISQYNPEIKFENLQLEENDLYIKIKNFQIKKPFKIKELFLVIDNLFYNDKVILANHYVFYPLSRILEDSISGQKIELTEKESSLIESLSKSLKGGLSKDDILSQVWKYNNACTHTVETHIYRLRQKISRELIQTSKDGYYFIAKV